jgi:hemerythrin-like domain-containing protein
MMPIGSLMIEHRLIERMLSNVEARLKGWESGERLDLPFLETTVDFVRTYADRCHHGKEEDILFKELLAKDLPSDIAEATRRLTAEHAWARETLGGMEQAVRSYAAGDVAAASLVTGALRALLDFYPVHIRFEDKEYFKPAMSFFTREEQDAMLAEFREFDRLLIHEHYRRVVERLEATTPEGAA